MSEKPKLNEEQQKDFDTLLSNNVKPEDALKIVTGEFEGTATDLYPKLDTSSEKATDASILAAQGLNIDLITPASERAKKSQSQVLIDEVGIEQESGYISGKDLFESNGIAAGKDTELDGNIRYLASFGLNNPQATERNLKKLIIDNLKQNYDIDTINKYAEGIEVKYQTLKFGGKEDQGLIYRIPKELGGTGFFAAVDSPLIGMRDFSDMGADTAPIVASIIAGTFGSYAGPVGTVAGSASAGALTEYARLLYGYHKLGLQRDMYPDPEEFNDVALKAAIKYGALDAVATSAFLGAAKLVLPTILGKNSLSSNTLKEFVEAKGKTNNEVLEKVTKVKNKFQKNFNLTEQEANDYFAVSLGKALIESPALQKKSRIAKGLIADEVESIKTKATFKTIEDKIIKKTTGLRTVDNTTADLLIDAAESEVKSLSRTAINKAELDAVTKTDDLLNLEKDTIGDVSTEILDRFGVTIDDSYRALQAGLTEVDDVITQYVTNFKGPIDLKGFTPVIKLIQKDKKFFEFDIFPKGEIRKVKPGSKTFKKVKDRNTLIALRKLFERTGYKETAKDFKTLAEGFATLQKQGKLTLKEIYGFKNAIGVFEEQSVGTAKGVYRQIKGRLNNIIYNNLMDAPDEVVQAFQKQQKLLSLKQNNIFKNWSNDFGGGSNKTAFQTMVTGRKLAAESESLFKKFVDDSISARQNADELGTLINSGVIPESLNLTIKNTLYRNYFNNVFPKDGVKKLTHDEFISKFGKNYESILGKKEYNTFFKKAGKVVKGYENAQNFILDQNTAIAKALPGLSVDIVNNSAPGQIVKHIIESSNKKNITGLLKALPDTTKANIRTLFLNEMMERSTGAGKAGGFIYKSTESLNGEKLISFLKQNRGSIKQLYNDNFYDTFFEMGQTLRMLQEPVGSGSMAAGKGITDIANQAGLFVDIFAGPLNHKRLVLNRVARIMDIFKINSDNLFLFTDYGKFIEAAKKNFLGGNYPRFMDNMGIKQRGTLIDKVLKKIKIDNKEGIGEVLSKTLTEDSLISLANRIPTLGLYDLNRGLGARKMFTGNPLKNPLVYKEYSKDKYEEVRGMDKMENNADVFYPVDVSGKFAIEALQSVFSKIGKGGKFVKEAISGAKEEEKRDFEKEEFEKKYGN